MLEKITASIPQEKRCTSICIGPEISKGRQLIDLTPEESYIWWDRLIRAHGIHSKRIRQTLEEEIRNIGSLSNGDSIIEEILTKMYDLHIIKFKTPGDWVIKITNPDEAARRAAIWEIHVSEESMINQFQPVARISMNWGKIYNLKYWANFILAWEDPKYW